MMKNMSIILVLFLACNAAEALAPQKEPVVQPPVVEATPEPVVAPAPAPEEAKVHVKLAPDTTARLQELNVELPDLFKAYNAEVTKWNRDAKQALKPFRDRLKPLAQERFQLIVKAAEQRYLKPECYIMFATGDSGKQCKLDGALWDVAGDGRILTQ